MRITRLDTRLFAYCLLYFLQALAAMCGLVLTVDVTSKVGRISAALARGAEPSTLVRYFLLEIPPLVLLAVPAALAVACGFSVARLVKKREHIVTLSGGISLHRTLAPLIALGVVAGAGWFALSEWVVPPAVHERTALKSSLFSKKNAFHDAVAVESSGPEARIFHIEHLVKTPAGMRAEGLHCFVKKDGRNTMEIHASSAVWIPAERRWKLSGAVAFEYDASGFRKRVSLRYLPSGLTFADFRVDLSPTALSLGELAELNAEPLYRFHYYRRLAFPAALVLLAALVLFVTPPLAAGSLFHVLSAALFAALCFYLTDMAGSALLSLTGPFAAACILPAAWTAATLTAAIRLRT